jgi:hypothetical protein
VQVCFDSVVTDEGPRLCECNIEPPVCLRIFVLCGLLDYDIVYCAR